MVRGANCAEDCLDWFTMDMWGVWDAEGNGGDPPQALFQTEKQAALYIQWLHDTGVTNVDLCALPVVVDGSTHNCIHGRRTHIDHARAAKIKVAQEKRESR